MNGLCPVAGQAAAAAPPRWTVGGVLRGLLSAVQPALNLSARQAKVLGRLALCGTPALGANLLRCPQCQCHHWLARSCGDRHCPGCLAGKSRQWLFRQKQSLLPVTYYHCVFTVPSELNGLFLSCPELLYPLLFAAAAQSLLQFGRQRLGGDVGVTAVLHTWGQKLGLHPHLHCIVTGGALSSDGRRWRAPGQGKFLFPVRALGALFRGKFLDGLRRLFAGKKLSAAGWESAAARQRWFSLLYSKPWVVFAKRPFGGPEQVLTYLANYTHRVALSNRRLVAVDETQRTVTFTWRDYQDGARVKELTLPAQEFIRRFALHILPAGLVRIRHYGILGNNRRQRDIQKVQELLPPPGPAPVEVPAPERLPMRCPRCGQPGMLWWGVLDSRGITHLFRRPRVYFDSS